MDEIYQKIHSYVGEPGSIKQEKDLLIFYYKDQRGIKYFDLNGNPVPGYHPSKPKRKK